MFVLVSGTVDVSSCTTIRSRIWPRFTRAASARCHYSRREALGHDCCHGRL